MSPHVQTPGTPPCKDMHAGISRLIYLPVMLHDRRSPQGRALSWQPCEAYILHDATQRLQHLPLHTCRTSTTSTSCLTS